MADAPQKQSITVVPACMNRNGSPTFVLTEVAVTPEEAEEGIHYYLTEAELVEAGYEEPFVHFDATEAPPFLHPAVRQHLGLPAAGRDPTPTTLLEKH
jgi:hypothetical protein